MRHRGPDGDGVRVLGRVGLAHTRLSIIDLEGGQQPMANADKSLFVTFNGEIYNYLELRADLESKGHKFQTKSDTETILHLYEEMGAAAVDALRGMFAFVLYDLRRETLIVARDPFGIKPLYYYEDENLFVFASELKAILRHPGPCGPR